MGISGRGEADLTKIFKQMRSRSNGCGVFRNDGEEGGAMLSTDYFPGSEHGLKFLL
jgi:hypothetical protein